MSYIVEYSEKRLTSLEWEETHRVLQLYTQCPTLYWHEAVEHLNKLEFCHIDIASGINAILSFFETVGYRLPSSELIYFKLCAFLMVLTDKLMTSDNSVRNER